MNRPPTPREYLGFGEWCDVVFQQEECDEKQNSAMQEALTAEWLIEQGLMPDPTDFPPPVREYMWRPFKGEWYIKRKIINGFVCYDVSEDKTK
jgi:hypothetical protein